MKKILLLTEFFPPRFGGIERSCQLMAERWGQDLTVVAPPTGESAAFDQDQPYRVVRRSLFSGRTKPTWLWLFPWLRQQHRRGAEFVIFGHYSSAVGAGWLAKPSGLPYAVLVHGNDLLMEEQRPAHGQSISQMLKSAAWVGVNSAFTAARVQAHGVAWSKIIRTHPAVTGEPFEAAETRSPDGAIHLVTVCRLVPRKNVATVIKAVAELQAEFPQLIYDIIGDGPEKNELEKLVDRLGLRPAIIFHGQVDDQKKWELMKQSAVAIMVPDVRQAGSDVEGLGLFFLEAAAMGLPIIASHTGGISDAVKNDVNGLLVDPSSVESISQALRLLLPDQAKRQALGQAGQTMMRQEFTAKVRVGRVVTMIERAHQKSPPLISVVIPAYQSAQTMRQTLESVLAQTWPQMEIIVVDDGSTDDLATAVAPFTDRMRLIRQSNHGAPVARNRGAAAASGEFILFLDADTVLQPEALTDMAVVLQTHPDASYAYSDFRFGPKNFHLFEFSADKIRQQNFIHTTSLMRREHFPGFDPALKRFQDWDLWLTMLAQGRVGLWVPKKLFTVQQRAGGMSTWIPRFVYKLPYIGQGRGNKNIAAYRKAEQVIRVKHRLS